MMSIPFQQTARTVKEKYRLPLEECRDVGTKEYIVTWIKMLNGQVIGIVG